MLKALHCCTAATAVIWRAGGAMAVRVRPGRIGAALRDAALALPAPAADTFVLWCGPPGFNAAVRGAAAELGHAESRCFEF